MNKVQTDLFILLRNALWKCGQTCSCLIDVDSQNIYTLAKEQCVLGIVADAFHSLGRSQCSSRERLRWVGAVVGLERKNAELNEFVYKLFRKLHAMGLAPVLMKGQALAANYPSPLHRQCGDVDVYFKHRNDCDKAVAWVENVDRIAAESSDNKRERKHFTFSIGDSVVELHYFMCLFENGKLQRRLQEIIDWEFTHNEPFYVEIDGKQIETVPPTLSVLHQIIHIARHLLEAGVGLRQICDLAVFVNKHHEDIDVDRLNGYLDELQLTTTAKALGYIMVKNLGLRDECVPFGVDERYADFILQEIFDGGNFGKKKVCYRKGKNSLQRKITSIFYFYQRCRLYKPLLPMEARSYFWNKIRLNFKLIFVRHY